MMETVEQSHQSEQVRQVRFSSSAGELVGAIYLPADRGENGLPGLIICHGIPSGRNSSTQAGDEGYPGLARRFAGAGFLTMIFNFRGTGQSEGNFDIVGWMDDLNAAIRFLVTSQLVDPTRVSLMGFSGGAAVSICGAATNQRIRAVVACASPARWERLGEWASAESYLAHARKVGIVRDPDFPPDLEQWWRGFQTIVPVEHVSRISPRPLLLIHGENDDVVPPHHARELFEKAGKPRELRWIPAEGHRLRLSRSAMDAALAWLRRVNSLGSPP